MSFHQEENMYNKTEAAQCLRVRRDDHCQSKAEPHVILARPYFFFSEVRLRGKLKHEAQITDTHVIVYSFGEPQALNTQLSFPRTITHQEVVVRCERIFMKGCRLRSQGSFINTLLYQRKKDCFSA